MDTNCTIQNSIHSFSLIQKYVSWILGTYHISEILFSCIILFFFKDTVLSDHPFLTKYGSISKCDGISIEIDGSVVGEAADGTVTSQVPGTSGFDCKDCIIGNGVSVLCIVYNIDGSCKGTVSFQSHGKGGNRIYDNVTVKVLLVCGKYHLCAVCTCSTPPR